MNERIEAKLKLLPDSPGVYKMYNAAGEIIYVGKAKVLKNRVRQYFQSQKNMEPKVSAMVSHIDDLEYILTASETEALTLESNLIKAYMPRYNILLKDDKHFPYVRLDVKQDYPRFEVVRRVKKDGARYFGPYLSATSLREALDAVRETFPVRHCKKDVKKAAAKGERPCIMYHIGKCCAPCSGSVSREEYHKLLDSVARFLDGDITETVEELTARMNASADCFDFEKAAVIRDRINAISILGERQRAISHSKEERDVFALGRDGQDAVMFALFVRDGKVSGTRAMRMEAQDAPAGDVMTAFLMQYYSDIGHVPSEITLYDAPADADSLTDALRDIRGKAVNVVCPARGDKRRQTEMAYQNAMDVIFRERELDKKAWERGEGALVRLCGAIGLEEIPKRVECYDNSHIQGHDTVSSMVVFTDGQPDKKEYRRFRVKCEAGGDDIAAMKETLERRFKRAQDGDEKFGRLPELLIVDGGRAQLGAAIEVLGEFGLDMIPAIGLAESNETIILPGEQAPVALLRSDPALHFIERIRDEAHRFAITYHRSLRGKESLLSQLEQIDGIGPKRRRALFEAFITKDAISNADIDTLAAVDGMNRPAAEKVYNHFHDGGNK